MKLQSSVLQPNQTIIIGYSGGPDSTYLLHALKQIQSELNLKLIAVHLDHQWRDNSADDILFCKSEAEKLGLQFISKKSCELNTDIKSNGSKEELGRKLRRAFFAQVAREYNADAIALGHHADDQMETFFIRLMRGATLSGLTCMKATDGLYIRPLLGMPKQEIVTYLDTNKIPYLIDSTNASTVYLRNRIRLQVIPTLQNADERFSDNLLRAIEHLQQAEDVLIEITKEKLASCKIPISQIKKDSDALILSLIEVSEREKDSILNIEKLLSFQPYLIKRILLAWIIENKLPFTPSDGFLNEMIRFIKQPGTKKQHPLHEQWMLCKIDNTVQIKKLYPALHDC